MDMKTLSGIVTIIIWLFAIYGVWKSPDNVEIQVLCTLSLVMVICHKLIDILK